MNIRQNENRAHREFQFSPRYHMLMTLNIQGQRRQISFHDLIKNFHPSH